MVFGGVGADVFALLALKDTIVNPAGQDTIGDFSALAGDLIGLSALDADTGTGGDQAFTFIGNAAFSAAGQARAVVWRHDRGFRQRERGPWRGLRCAVEGVLQLLSRVTGIGEDMTQAVMAGADTLTASMPPASDWLLLARRSDAAKALEAYIRLCTCGGKAPSQDPVRSAGLVSPFAPGRWKRLSQKPRRSSTPEQAGCHAEWATWVRRNEPGSPVSCAWISRSDSPRLSASRERL